jgi:hypothetical protein
MIIVASVYLRFYIKVGVGLGTFLLTPTQPKFLPTHDCDSMALVSPLPHDTKVESLMLNVVSLLILWL